MNFLLFIGIIRILVQKLRCPDVGGNDQSQYRHWSQILFLLRQKMYKTEKLSWCDYFSQEVGQIHSAADPALRDPLRGLRCSWRINRKRLQNILWPGPRIIPGRFSAERCLAHGVCDVISMFHACVVSFSGSGGGHTLLFSKQRGKNYCHRMTIIFLVV